jgi:hypothetical protein
MKMEPTLAAKGVDHPHSAFAPLICGASADLRLNPLPSEGEETIHDQLLNKQFFQQPLKLWVRIKQGWTQAARPLPEMEIVAIIENNETGCPCH